MEYLDGRFGSAISNYKRAIKLDKKAATYHSNLASAYIEERDFESARKEFGIALTLDPELFEHRGTAGVTAHLLSSDDRARFCFEMARLYAQRGDEAEYVSLSDDVERGRVRCVAGDRKRCGDGALSQRSPRSAAGEKCAGVAQLERFRLKFPGGYHLCRRLSMSEAA